jgi:hypothetical protein
MGVIWKDVGYDVTMAMATTEATEPVGDSPGDALVSSLVAVLPALSSDPASVTASERSEVVVALASAVGRVEALLGQFANVAGANLDHPGVRSDCGGKARWRNSPSRPTTRRRRTRS